MVNKLCFLVLKINYFLYFYIELFLNGRWNFRVVNRLYFFFIFYQIVLILLFREFFIIKQYIINKYKYNYFKYKQMYFIGFCDRCGYWIIFCGIVFGFFKI